MASGSKADFRTSGYFPVSYRNATDARQAFRNAAQKFRRTCLVRINDAHDFYAKNNPSKTTSPDVKVALEAHARDYLIDSLLSALNWNITSATESYLENLLPEAPIKSVETETQRHIDYLGFDRKTEVPLLVVEAKRPGSPLPALAKSSKRREPLAEILLAGLNGAKLTQDWNEWLGQVGDYARSIKTKANVCPKRVVLTDGYWCIIFIEPDILFCDPTKAVATHIRVFEADSIDGSFHGELETRFSEIFGLLEFNQLADSLPALSTAELPFHFSAEDALEGLHGLILKYVSFTGIFSPTPLIQVSPIIFLRKPGSRWLQVQRIGTPELLPANSDEISDHLDVVADLANELKAEISELLPANHTWMTLEQHYADSASFEQLRGVLGSNDRYIIVTGAHTHYLRKQVSFAGCSFHSWVSAHAAGVHAPAVAAHAIQSTDPQPRVWFVDGCGHHCAHRTIETIKSTPVTPANRTQCGSRSADDHEAFCEIRGFEHHLCCRTCNFETVCEKAVAFKLPCKKPTTTVGS
jgi:hypothetical protein